MSLKKLREVWFGDGERSRILVDKGLVMKDQARRAFLIQINETMIPRGLVKPVEVLRDTPLHIGALSKNDEDHDVSVDFISREYPVTMIHQPERSDRLVIFTDVQGRETLLTQSFHFKWMQDVQMLKSQLSNMKRANKMLIEENRKLMAGLPEFVKDIIDVKKEAEARQQEDFGEPETPDNV